MILGSHSGVLWHKQLARSTGVPHRHTGLQELYQSQKVGDYQVFSDLWRGWNRVVCKKYRHLKRPASKVNPGSKRNWLLMLAGVAAGAGLLLLRFADATAWGAGLLGSGLSLGLLALLEPPPEAGPEAAEPPAPQPEPVPADRIDPLVATVIGALPDAAVLVSHDRRIELANAAMETLLGPLPRGDSIDLYLRQPQAVEAFSEALRSGGPTEREMVLLSPTERVFVLAAVPFGPQPQSMLIILRDLTRERLTDRMRVDFVANASHELRTPLAAVIGFIETLQNGAIDDLAARDRFLGIMNSEANRMVRLIDDLLSLSRIELDKFIRPVTPLNLVPVIEDVRSSLTMRLKSEQRKLAIQVPPALPDAIADRDQIIQVLHNLLSNAMKYGRVGSTITVSVERVGDSQLEVAVRDEGEGIPPEHLPRLTERFYRVDTARSRQMGGTGLGLAIVKHIIERHRGSLRIESRVGEGTTVTFRLPVASAEAVVAAALGRSAE